LGIAENLLVPGAGIELPYVAGQFGSRVQIVRGSESGWSAILGDTLALFLQRFFVMTRAEKSGTPEKDIEKQSSSVDRLKEFIDVESKKIANAFAAEAKDEERREIRQGVKASVPTVPMPVRLELEQVAQLKLLAAFEGTTASAIIRQCIAEHLARKAAEDTPFGGAVKALRRK
jgi:hypothetical protein